MSASVGLRDAFNRRIDYLRLSVTDRCNLRCLYCLPAQGFAGSSDHLTDAEIVRVVSIAARLGIAKVRLTGGEPLVRPQIASLVQAVSEIPGIEDVALSTNGLLLSGMAEGLRDAGLSRINVSLDTLRPERFQAIARFGKLADVLGGIRAALGLGFSPVKINTVVMKGINSDEIADFVALTCRWPVHVRFIELMPIGGAGFFSKERWLPLPQIQAECGELEPVSPDSFPKGFGPAVYFKRAAALGTVGFIAALSCNFCNRCNRLRLTAQGRLLPCLASEAGLDLREPLRSAASDAEIAELFFQAVAMKPERHPMEPEGSRVRESFMCALGG